MNQKALKMTMDIDKSVSEIVKHMALPTADPKIKNALARYVKGQVLTLLTTVGVEDTDALSSVLLQHFDNIKGDVK